MGTRAKILANHDAAGPARRWAGLRSGTGVGANTEWAPGRLVTTSNELNDRKLPSKPVTKARLVAGFGEAAGAVKIFFNAGGAHADGAMKAPIIKGSVARLLLTVRKTSPKRRWTELRAVDGPAHGEFSLRAVPRMPAYQPWASGAEEIGLCLRFGRPGARQCYSWFGIRGMTAKP